MKMTSLADVRAIESEMAVDQRWEQATVYERLRATCLQQPDGKAVSFQLTSKPGSRSETLTWSQLLASVTRAANLFRSLGVGEDDVVAYMLPTTNETLVTMLGGMTAGIVHPINPLLEVSQIASLLKETGARVLVTLKSFPKSDVAQKAAAAVALADSVEVVIEVDLLPHLSPPKSFIVPLIRPGNRVGHSARVIDFRRALAGANAESLDFEEVGADRYCAYFHTGGTTGMPKIAQHRHSAILYNGWLASNLLYTSEDVVLCPLPLFHVFAAYPIWAGCMTSGTHMVLPTPQGYRGDGVFDNFWKLCEHWGTSFIVTVPTAAAALMQRPVDADISRLQLALCGSAPMPVELFRRFEEATGVSILEGYGLTEATCLISVNPPGGTSRIGSVGLPFPYTEVKILTIDEDVDAARECPTGEVGEICVSNPGVNVGDTYTDEGRNRNLYAMGRFLRTGDLGRFDEDGYLWITGRQKDLIIRGGKNIDPALIEEALAAHPDVAFVGAVGQPDAKAGELPCAYVELVEGREVTGDDLKAHARSHVSDRYAAPVYVETVDELPKTAVGKVFKPDLRKMAISRVYGGALSEAGLPVRVAEVVEDKARGLEARITRSEGVDDAAVNSVLGTYTRPWTWH